MRQLIFSTILIMVALASIFTIEMPKARTDCTATLDNLIAATESATSLNVKDQAGLLGKASDAKAEYLASKMADAVKKLDNYNTKLLQLEATLGTGKEKISAEDVTVLKSAWQTAYECLTP